MPTPHLKKKNASTEQDEKICLFAMANFRNQMRRFGIKLDDRRRHMYVIGKTGMGKTTMLENMVLHDVYNGHGLGIVDPHGDFAEKIIDFVPSNRINDIIYVNPADVDYPIGFNILEVENEEQKHLVAAGLMAVFKKIWPDVWSSRMEYILNNTLLALLDYPGSTLLGINRMLGDKKYRKRVLSKVSDPVIKAFWQNEFANYEDRYRKEAVAPIQNKIGQFLSASVIRNMVAQVKSTINIREAMDNNKILIMNLSKGRIGEDNSRLLGGMLITKIQLAAMERVDTPEHERKDFFLYVDEFQNFATESFANILSEARKYRLSLIMAHQYIRQLTEEVRDAVFGNVGTIVSFRVGADDAEVLAKEYAPVFIEEDIVNLSKFNIFLKLMIDGVASQPFSATTMPPIGHPTHNAEKVVRVSRERYAKKRAEIEDKITRWSGMDTDDISEEINDTQKDKENKKAKDNKSSKEKNKDSNQEDKNQDKQKQSNSKETAETEQSVSTKPQPQQHADQISKEAHGSEQDISEETISLSSLLPQISKKGEETIEGKEKEPEEKTIENSKKEEKEEKEEGSAPTDSQTKKEESQDGQKAPKKKRRRRRRKKKKSGESNEQQNSSQGQSDSTDVTTGQTVSTQERVENSQGKIEKNKQDASASTVIKPDEIVRFTE